MCRWFSTIYDQYNPFKNKTFGFGQRARPLHDRYTRTGSCFHWGMVVAHSRYKFVAVFGLMVVRSETATWTQKCLKKSVGTSLESSRYNSFQGGGDGRGYSGYRNMYRMPWGSTLKEGG